LVKGPLRLKAKIVPGRSKIKAMGKAQLLHGELRQWWFVASPPAIKGLT